MAVSQLSNKKYMDILITAMFFVIFDRFLKTLALSLNKEIILLKNILSFSLTKNTNAAFSLNLGFDIVWLAVIITLLALIWLSYSLKQKNHFKSLILFTLILGSVSNIYDRLVYGAVIDYFSFANLNIFNLADCLIIVAAGSLLYQEFKTKPRNKTTN